MNDDESLQQAIHETVEIVPYDSSWPEKFEAERTRLLALFPEDFLQIEHVGSTAVAGLSAKPIIDIMAAVKSIETADALLDPLCAKGYATSSEFNATLKDKRWLMRHAEGRRTHHLHLVLMSGVDWLNKQRFRDILRADPQRAAEYEALKKSLCAAMGRDREAYTDAKTSFVEETLKRFG